MKFGSTKLLIAASVVLGLAFGAYKMTSSSSCCSATAETSGCSPSSCRGAKTKFGEATVISDLRLDLIDLKAEMEQSEDPSFDERSYDIHGIIGDSDDESLKIIADEVKLIEGAFSEKLNHEPSTFALPANKAKQVQYLSARIEGLKKLL